MFVLCYIDTEFQCCFACYLVMKQTSGAGGRCDYEIDRQTTQIMPHDLIDCGEVLRRRILRVQIAVLGLHRANAGGTIPRGADSNASGDTDADRSRVDGRLTLRGTHSGQA